MDEMDFLNHEEMHEYTGGVSAEEETPNRKVVS